MIPLLFVSESTKNTEAFIRSHILSNHFDPAFIFHLHPQEEKEYSIQQIRELKREIMYQVDNMRLYIFFEFDRSSQEAQNAFLKTLEESPKNTQFILTAANSNTLLPTIISRSKVIRDTHVKENKINRELFKKLEGFIAKPDLGILMQKPFLLTSADNALYTADQMLGFFELRLNFDPKAPGVSKEIIKTRALIKNNNIHAQLSIDHLLIYIYNTYSA